MSAAAPVWTGPSGGAWTYRFQGTGSHSPALTSDDRVLFSANQADGQGALFCVDLRTRHEVWSCVVPAAFSTSPVVNGGAVFIGSDDHRLYVVDLAGGEVLWSFDAGAPVVTQPVFFTQTSLCFGTADGKYWAVAYDATAGSGKMLWSIGSPFGRAGGVRATRAAADFGWIVYAVSQGGRSQFNSVPANSTSVIRAYPFDAEVLTEPVVVDGVAWFVLADGRFVRIAIARAASVAVPPSLKAPASGVLAADAMNVYATTSDGRFFGQPLAGGPAWHIPVAHSIPTGVVVHGGDAYFAGRDPAGKGDFYTLDLVAGPDQAAQTPVESLHGLVTSPPALRGGVVAFTSTGDQGSTLYAFHSDDTVMLSRVKFSSRLIAGHYDVSGEKEKPTRPEYQSVITVTDGHNIAQAGVRVALWASSDDTVVILPGGEVKLQTPAREPHYETTNASGQIPLTIWRDPKVDALFPGTASLYVRPDFFVSEYALQVFPDQETVTRLSGVQSDGLELAQGYDGGKVVKESYRNDPAKRDSIAKAIRNTMGAQENVSSNRLTKSPAQSTSSSSAAAGGATTSAAVRGIAPGEHPHWTLDLDNGEVLFVPRTSEEIDRIRETAKTTTLGLGNDFKHFVRHVTHGTEKVANVTWKHVEEGAERFVHMTANAGEFFYDFAVKSVDEAVQVLRGVIKDLITSIERFVEWLSWLFEWDDILSTKAEIERVTRKILDDFQEALNDPAAKEKLDGTLAGMRGDILAAFASLAQQLTGTVSSAQQGAPSQQEVLSPHGVDITAQAGWLLRKLPPADTIRFDIDPQDLSALTDACTKFFTTSQNIAASEFADLAERITASVQSFFGLFDGNPEGLLKQAIADVLAVFEDVAEVILDFLIAIFDALFELLQTTVDVVRRILSTPIDAGYVSRLYRTISGSDLTLLDLAALLIAVPATITLKLTASAAGKSTAQDGPTRAELICTTFGFVFYGLLALAEIKTEETESFRLGLLNLGQGAVNAVVSFLSMDGMFEGRDETEYWANVAFLAMQMPSTLFNFFVYAFEVQQNDEAKAFWKTIQMPAWTALGLVSAALSVGYGLAFPEDYEEPDGTGFLANFLTSVPYFTSAADAAEFPFQFSMFLVILGYGVGGAGMSAIQAALE